MKKVSVYVAALILVFSVLIFPENSQAAVQASGPKLRILEIVASGGSQLKGILGESNYEYTLMTMKKFVAQREELDGKYDVLAIMEGDYTSSGVSGQKHNTTNVMNDITNLKANEIINDFINKGQPVILHTKSLATGNKLKGKFENQTLLNKKNVINYVSSTSGGTGSSFLDWFLKDLFGLEKSSGSTTLKNDFNAFLDGTDYKQAPRFTLNQSPSATKAHVPGDSMDFTMNITVPASLNNRSLQAKLYIDSNFDDKYTTDEIVLEKDIASNSTNLSYKLPKGYSGVRYWKLELVDQGTNFKSYQKGMIKFIDKKVELKVLQVKNRGGTGYSLKNLGTDLLNRGNEYSINIDETNMEKFGLDRKGEPNYSHELINGKYNMVIFGFADSYNVNGKINLNAKDSLKRFIASQQSIMFTHDTIFEESNDLDNNWVRYFKEDTGQINPKTNLGYAAPNRSTTTKKVNEGLMTAYPFSLSDNINIVTTHNQYFTLDLEDPNIIPWYNITGSDRDVYDSWNHYYTYSKGNITYSGSGHTNSNFADDEKQLFVNTMYRAFLGSNHAPEITIHTPTENQVIPSNQTINLSYTIQDYDLKDKKVSTKVYLNGKEVTSEARKGLTNGTTVDTSIPHGLPDGGELNIKVEATDESGAISEKMVKVNVQKINANFDIARTLTSGSPVEAGKQTTIEYTITPRSISGEEAAAIKTNTVSVGSIKLKETFPSQLEVSGDGTKSGTAESGITLEKTLNNIVYTKQSNGSYTAEPVKYTVQVTPLVKKQYVLDRSILSYQDLSSGQRELKFNTITFSSAFALTGIAFPDSYVLNKGTEKNFSLDLQHNPSDATIQSTVWTEESGGTILELNSSDGTAKVVKEGNTYLKVTVTDIFGHTFEKRVPVTVRIPVDKFTLSNEVLEVGETKKLPISDATEEEKHSLAIKVDDPSIVQIDKDKLEMTGLKPGEVTITATGMKSNGEKLEQTAKIKVTEVPVTKITVTPSVVRINKLEEFSKFIVQIFPENATDQSLEWSVSDSSILEKVADGKIKGIGTGSADVIVSSKKNPEVKTTIEVQVGQPLDGIKVDNLTVQKGQSQAIHVEKIPLDATNVQEVTYETEDNGHYIKLSGNGVVEGIRVGTALVTVTVVDDKETSYKQTIKVTVTPKKTEEEGEGDKY